MNKLIKKFTSFTNRLNYRTLFTLLLFVSCLLLFVLRLNSDKSPVQAAWWDDTWHYRQSIGISSGSEAVTDFPVNFSFDTQTLINAGKMQSDCGDMRFTSSAGVPLPDYWIATGCGTTATDIWVKADSVPASGGTTIYMYYGSPSAPNQSNADNMNFSFYDDFESGMDKWDTVGTWTTNATSVGGTYSAYAAGSPQTLVKNVTAVDSTIIEMNVRFAETNLYHYPLHNGQYILVGRNNGTFAYYTGSTYTTLPVTTSYSAGVWYKVKLLLDQANDSYTVFINNANKGTITNNSGFNSAAQLNQIYPLNTSAASTGGMYVDNVIQRAYIATDPIATVTGSEEQGSGPVAHWRFDEGYGSTAYDEYKAYNGTLGSGDSAPTWSAGAVPKTNQVPLGKSLTFDGTNDYVDVGNTIPSVKSVSFWLNPSSTPIEVVDFDGGTHYISIDDNNDLTTTGFTSPTIYVNGIPSTAISTNAWQLVTITTGTSFTATHITIGKQSTNYYLGQVDELKLFNFALTSEQVKKEYNRFSSVALGAGQKPGIGTTGPIAWWKLDEGVGNTINDISGNNHVGRLINMDSTNWVPGKIGKAVKLNGTDESLDSSINPGDFDFGAGSFTITGWFKYNDTSATRGIIGKMKGGPPGYLVYYDADIDNVCFALDDDDSWDPDDSACGNVSDSDNWHFFAAIKDGTSSIKLYLDGILAGSDLSLSAPNPDTSSLSSLPIGYDYFGTDNYWNGYLDDIRVYNYARSIDQIHYDMGGSPIGYWRFDEGYGSTAYDEMKNSNGTLGTGTSSPSWVDGVTPNSLQKPMGKSLYFDGNDYIDLSSHVTNFEGLNTGSISLWFKSSGSTAAQTLFTITDKDTTQNFLTLGAGNWSSSYDDESIMFFLRRTNTDRLTMFVRKGHGYHLDGNWHHLVVSTGNGDNAIYIDGIRQEITYGTGSVSTDEFSNIDTPDSCRIASRDLTSDLFLAGSIDEFKIYNYALTPDEVKIEYNRNSAIVLGAGLNNSDIGSSNLVGWWKMDEGIGATIYDSSGNNNIGATQNGPLWAIGQKGKALDFETANSQSVSVADSTSLSITGNHTITAWIKPESITGGTEFTIVSKSAPDIAVPGENFSFALTQYGSEIRMYTQWGVYSTTNSANLTAGSWYHISEVYNAGTTSISFYVNGVYTASTNPAPPASSIPDKNNSFCIGTRNCSGMSFLWPYDGIIDNVKIYNTTLTQSQIAYEYNGGLPVAHWRLDEKEGSTAYDESNNNNDSTLGTGTSSPVWIAGRFNNGLSFDGNDYTTSGDVELATGNQITVSAWAKISASQNAYAQIIGKTYSSHVYSLHIDQNDTTKVAFSIDSWLDKAKSNSSLNDDQWHHFIGTYDGTTIRLYVDGILQALTGACTSNIADTADYLTIGGQSNAGGRAYFFNGTIDEAKIYNYALTSDQVKVDFNSSSAVHFN